MGPSGAMSRIRGWYRRSTMNAKRLKNISGMSAPTTFTLLFLKDIRMAYRHIPTAIILGLLIGIFTPLLWVFLYFANVAANNAPQLLGVDTNGSVVKLRNVSFSYHVTGPEFGNKQEALEFEKFSNYISMVCLNATNVDKNDAEILIKVKQFNKKLDYELIARPPPDVYYYTNPQFYPDLFNDLEVSPTTKLRPYSESHKGLAAQACIDMTFYYHVNNYFYIHDIYVRKLPPILANARAKVIKPLLIAIKTIMPLGIFVPAILGIVGVCDEKSNRVHMYLMMMGMRRYAFYAAHLLSAHLKMYLYAVPAGIAVAVFVPQVGGWAFALFLLFGHFCIAFIYLTSTLCKSTAFAVALSIGFFTLSTGIDVWVSKSIEIFDSKKALALAIFNPVSTYNLGFRHLDVAVTYNQSVNIFTNWNYYYPLGYSYIFLTVQTAFCLALLIYFDYVLPIDDSPKLHPLFLFGYSKTEKVDLDAAELPIHRDKIIPADCPSEMMESSMEEDRGRFPPYFEMELTSKRPEIEISKLVKKWPNGEIALKGVSLKAFKGQVTALLGPNGAGKSTIFGCLAGFIKPSAGLIRISGEPPSAATDVATIGYCPQWNPLFSYLTVAEHLNFYGSIKTGDNVVKEDVDEILRLIDLSTERKRKVRNLNAGQKRKLSVGIALIGNCKVLLLDEPTAGMDLAGRKTMIDIIERVKPNKAVLLTTHYMDDADYLSDKIMIMAKGELVCNGSVDFLRARFGTGIMLTIEFSTDSDDESSSNPGKYYRMAADVLNAVLLHCDGARMDGPIGAKFNMILPHGSQRTFPDLFGDLESRKEELGIEGFELKVNKLEQVFLKVTDVVDASKEDAVSVEEQVKEFLEVRGDEVSSFCLVIQQICALLTRKMYFIKSHLIQHAILFLFIIPLIIPLIMNLAYPSSRHHEDIHDKTESTDLSNYPHLTAFVAGSFGSKVVKPIIGLFNRSNVNLIRLSVSGNIVDEPKRLMLKRIIEQFPHVLPPLAFGMAVDVKESMTRRQKRDIVVYYRTLFPNGAAVALNALANSCHDEKTTIVTSVGVEQDYPLELSIIGSATIMTILIPIFTTFVFMYPILLLSTERQRRTIITYLCSRVPRYLYWSTAFLGDSLLAAVPLLLLTVILFSALYFKIQCLSLYLLVLLPTCIAYLAQSYVFGMLFRKGSLATSLLQIFNVIMAGVSYFVGGLIAHSAGTIVVQVLAVLFPSAIIFELILFLEIRCSTTAKSQIKTLFTMCHHREAPFCGGEILIAAYSSAVLQLILFGILVTKTWLTQRIRCRGTPKALTERSNENVNVVEERERVESAGTTNWAVCAQNIRKDYGKKTALRNVTFGVSEGEIFGLLGPCGSGKSTILAMLSGVYPITAGNAYINGIDVETTPLVGYCTQAHSLLNELTIRQTFILFARLSGAKNAVKSAELLMEILQLEAKANSVIDNCSCGEKRRISIGVSLIVNPRLQLLDEPTSGVDPRTRRSLWQVLTAFSSFGSTIIMASDSVDESDSLCSRIAFLANGDIVGIGNGDHLRRLYGNSYLLSITVYNPEATLAEIIDTKVQKMFNASPITVVETIPTMSWTFPRSPDVPLSELYGNLIELVDSLPLTLKREKSPVKDFYIVGANLEDVFHAIAKRTMNMSSEKEN